MENAIFFSGTHGTGKTTTIEQVEKTLRIPIYDENRDHGNPYEQPFMRQIWRLTHYYLDALKIAEMQKSERLLADRCVFDHQAYTQTFCDLGWISQDEYNMLQRLRRTYFDDSKLLPQNVVLFFPPEDWTIERIKERWTREKKKWREGDLDYLKRLRDNYLRLFDAENERRKVCVVRDTDLEKRITTIKEFIEKVFPSRNNKK